MFFMNLTDKVNSLKNKNIKIFIHILNFFPAILTANINKLFCYRNMYGNISQSNKKKNKLKINDRYEYEIKIEIKYDS